jgi:cation:H+ antiporter
MLVDSLLIGAGLVLLVAGGEAIVRGASGVGLLARLSPSVVGLTIVAAGTSMPELVVSLKAAQDGSHGIALGNIVGSNIFNIGVVLGLTALLRPLRIQSGSIRLEWPVMLLAACALLVFSRDAKLDRAEAGWLLAGLVAFVFYLVRSTRASAQVAQSHASKSELGTASFGSTGGRAWAFNLAAVALGAVLLAFGSDTMVRGAVGVAEALGVAPTVIGLTIVAAGTSTPELVTSLVAAWRGKDDIAVTNVLGSNIFNLLGIAGATAMLAPLPVPPEMVQRDIWWMLGLSALLFPLMRSRLRITRLEGGLLLGIYLAYVAMLLLATPNLTS